MRDWFSGFVVGKGLKVSFTRRASLRRTDFAARVVQVVVVAVIILLVAYPLYWILAGSFRPGEQWGLGAYRAVLSDQATYRALANTLVYALAATILSVFISVPLAWVTTRTNTPLGRFWNLIAIVPFVAPPFVGALAWSVLAAPRTGFLNVAIEYISGFSKVINIYSSAGLIWVLALYSSPYVYLLTASALSSMDPALEEAAEVAGTTRVQILFKIVLPLIAPGLLAGALLAFINCLEQFGIPAIIGGPANIEVLTTTIYQHMSQFPPSYAEAAAVSILLMGVTIAAALAQRQIIRGRGYTTITGRGMRAKTVDLGRWRYLSVVLCASYLLVAVGLPFSALVLSSLLPGGIADPANLWPTAENYIFVLLRYPISIRALWNSVFLAALGATICVLLVSVASYLIVRSRARLAKALEFFILMPFAIPGIVFSVGLFWAYIRPPIALYGTIWILLVSYVTRFLPFTERAVSASLVQVDRSLEEAMGVCGGSWGYTFRKVVLPLVKPGLLAAWVLLFVIMMRELGASILLYSTGAEVVSVVLFDLWESGEFGSLSAYATSVSVIVVVVLYIFQRIFGISLTEKM